MDEADIVRQLNEADKGERRFTVVVDDELYPEVHLEGGVIVRVFDDCGSWDYVDGWKRAGEREWREVDECHADKLSLFGWQGAGPVHDAVMRRIAGNYHAGVVRLKDGGYAEPRP